METKYTKELAAIVAGHLRVRQNQVEEALGLVTSGEDIRAWKVRLSTAKTWRDARNHLDYMPRGEEAERLLFQRCAELVTDLEDALAYYKEVWYIEQPDPLALELCLLRASTPGEARKIVEATSGRTEAQHKAIRKFANLFMHEQK